MNLADYKNQTRLFSFSLLKNFCGKIAITNFKADFFSNIRLIRD